MIRYVFYLCKVSNLTTPLEHIDFINHRLLAFFKTRGLRETCYIFPIVVGFFYKLVPTHTRMHVQLSVAFDILVVKHWL